MHPSLSLLLPLNIGLPLRLFLGSSETDVMSLVLVLSPTLTNQGPTKTQPGQVYPQYLPARDLHQVYCYLESVLRVKPRQLHQMADSTNPSLGGRVIQCHYLWGYSKNYWGFQGCSPFQFLSTVFCSDLTVQVKIFNKFTLAE